MRPTLIGYVCICGLQAYWPVSLRKDQPLENDSIRWLRKQFRHLAV
ncbi:MAG: hypothetical protein ACK5CL_07945 [Sphingomonadales bacterium]